MNVDELLAQVAARRRLPPPEQRRAIRMDAHVSQGQVGEVLGVSKAAVCRWENGSRTPRGALLIEYVGLLRRLGGRDGV